MEVLRKVVENSRIRVAWSIVKAFIDSYTFESMHIVEGVRAILRYANKK